MFETTNQNMSQVNLEIYPKCWGERSKNLTKKHHQKRSVGLSDWDP